MSEVRLRQDLIRFAHLCYERNLLVAMDGNLSTLLPDGNVLCTKAGCHKGLLTDDDLVVIDRRGNKIRGEGNPTSEMAMHLACYDARPDIGAVVHAHPPISVAFTVAGVSMARCVLPEVVLTMGVIPTLEYETTGTSDLAALVGQHIVQHDAILMDRHGAVCVGSGLLEAFCHLETMEHTALITKTARDLGRVKELPPHEAEKLRSLGLKRYGGPPVAVAQADLPGADLPDACRTCSDEPDPSSSGLGSSGVGARERMRMARVTSQPLDSLESALSDAARFSLSGSVDVSPETSLERAVTSAVLQALKDG